MTPQPDFSIVMATLNSMRTLERSLKSIRAQDYAQDLIEILVIDGGSTDGTRELAVRMGCRVIDNPRVEPVNAKLIGMREARGRYLMHVDSDEVLLSPKALHQRAEAFARYPQIKMVFSTGYQNPDGCPFAARYINEFGDPFSMFFYHLSKDARFFAKDLRTLAQIEAEDENCTVLTLRPGRQAIMENAACGNAIDLEFFRDQFPELCDKPWGPVHFFYHMQKHTRTFAITKNDPVLHYSADHMRGFLRKIQWRVRNNIFFSQNMGSAGFNGRVQFENAAAARRKFLYIPYAFLILPALLDALRLMWTRRDPAYILHLPLTLFTACTIVWSMLCKWLGYRPKLKSYG